MRSSPPLPSAILAAVLAAGAASPSVALADPPALPPRAQVVPAPPPPSPARDADDDTRELRFRAGVSLTAIGSIALIVGGVLVGRALVDKSAAAPFCDAANRCDLQGYTLGSEAQDFARVAQVILPAGLALAGAGVGLIVSASPKKAPATAWISGAPGGIRAGLRF